MWISKVLGGQTRRKIGLSNGFPIQSGGVIEARGITPFPHIYDHVAAT